MNSTDDQRFFDLAMKIIAGQPTESERRELDSLIAKQPALKAEMERLQADTHLAREVLPLVAATQDSGAEFPGYARERLQTKVRQSLGKPDRGRSGAWWNWKWLVVSASGLAALVLLAVVLSQRGSSGPRIEIALLDTAEILRSADTNEVAAFSEKWKSLELKKFESEQSLRSWETNQPSSGGPVIRVVYDRTAAEIRVTKFEKGRKVEKLFLIAPDMPQTLQAVDKYIISIQN